MSDMAKTNCKKNYEDSATLNLPELQKTVSDSNKEDNCPSTSEVNSKFINDPYFSVNFCNIWKVRICKLLVPLKLALFVWFGAGATITTFIALFSKQRGLTVSNISVIYVISPFVQFLTTLIYGIISDKIGRSKPLLLMCLVGCIAVTILFLIAPRINTEKCSFLSANLECNSSGFNKFIVTANCSSSENFIQQYSCKCRSDTNSECLDKAACDNLIIEDFSNLSIYQNLDESNENANFCNFNETINLMQTSCAPGSGRSSCEILCILKDSEFCTYPNHDETLALVVQFILFFLFFVSHSSIYRFFDITSMFLVSVHAENYGQQRFWAILGSLLLPSLSGYIVDATSAVEGENNYTSALYVFIVGTLLTIITVWKLDVHIQPPGKLMWRKTTILLKNYDNLAFVFAVFILGTSWGFNQIFTFLYMGDLGSPGLLIGLLKSMNSLYGLPFLMTAQWWIKKIGTRNIIVLAFLAYAVQNIGLSFLINPWFSLLLETMSILTYHLSWVAVMQHCYDISPEGLRVTVNAFIGGLHFNFGRSSGSLIGGTIMSNLGGRVAHRVMGGICLVSAGMYSLFLFFNRRYIKCDS
ncbi:major facilitator superfamily domain-containing protein 6-A-like [Stegodyphus dumicola]|uniref:major facilitator superfamily domain-containing protein 6-A-like n=1 Tax=Stegodyphus dumicola TaxID=202533 RepID=UPI0015AE2C8E|nr:major facilitator superfamily domain-containing protein 6-A-like [Stegodyphus dumicola]XP_035219976.1 major facilitator superfamily domain-containing protein 6-A-like [Stegodyphus dumicola]